MKNKLLLVIIAVLLGGLMLAGYSYLLAPEGIEGEKDVTIQVMIDNQEIDREFHYTTDREFLYGLLEDEQEELGVSFQSFGEGSFVSEVLDYQPQGEEFFQISVNDSLASTGVEEIPIRDGDKYIFELKESFEQE